MNDLPRFEIREVFSKSLPDSFQLRGAALGNSGHLVLWATRSPYLLVIRDSAVHSVGVPYVVRPAGAAFAFGDSVIEVVDAVRRTVMTFALDGARLGERRFAAASSVEAAAKVGGRWVVAGLDSTGASVVSAVDSSRTSIEVLRTAVGLRVHLSVHGDELLVTATAKPFTIERFNSELQRVGDTWPAGIDSASTVRAAMATGSWVSLPAVAVGSGYLQTLSDLTSDRRILVLYGQSGRAIRYRVLDAPVGFVASGDAPPRLVGAREHNGMEVVVREWKWMEG